MIQRVTEIVAVLFGFATLIEGGSVLFIDGAARAAAGNVIPFVLIFNFASGFLYIGAGGGSFLHKPWAPQLAIWIAQSNALMWFLLMATIFHYSIVYEIRTPVAMTLRTVFWLWAAWTLSQTQKGNSK